MDDFHITIKSDLRETRFSQNYECSVELIDKQDAHLQPQNYVQKFQQTSPIHYKSFLKHNSFIQQSESFMCYQQIVNPQTQTLWKFNHQSQNKKQEFENFTKSVYFFDEKSPEKPSYCSTQDIRYLQYQNNVSQEDSEQENSQSQEEEEFFSEKLSLIKSLQQKLSSLQQKIKISSNPSSYYFNDYKVNLEKQYQIYCSSSLNHNQAEFLETHKAHQIMKAQISQISNNLSQCQSFQKTCPNHSLQSESMLLDTESQICEKETPTQKIQENTIPQNPQVQIIETIRIVQVPYLIEVHRDHQDQIQSKKNFFFQENQDIHRTFQEFTNKQKIHQKIFTLQTQIYHQTSFQQNQTFGQHDHSISFSNDFSNNLQPQRHRNQQNSVLSVNQSNRTFHNLFKDKMDEISFNYDESNHILSKLLGKQKEGEIEELEDKVKTLEIQNNELKQKVKEFQTQKQFLQTENQELAQWLIRLCYSEQMYEEKIKKYQEQLYNLQVEFVQIFKEEQAKLRQHYEQRIQQFQTEQAEYAARIIGFEEIFQEFKATELKLTDFIETQNQQIGEMKKLCKEKELQTEHEILKRQQLEDIIVFREKQLKSIIENLQRDNSQLKNTINQFQIRYESEGFYILKQEAQELKKTIQDQQVLHGEKLDKMENRYSKLISKYQTELDLMKNKLQKVRLNKSTSISNFQYSLKDQIKFNKFSPLRKRQSVLFSKISRSMQCSSFDQSFTKFKQFLDLQIRHAQSTEDSHIHQKNLQKNMSALRCSQQSFVQKSRSSSICMAFSQLDRSQELLILEVEILREQNSKIQQHLEKERQQKHILSQKLIQINDIMNKYMSQVADLQSQAQKSEHIFMKCVQELEKQYKINKKLREKLQRFQSAQLKVLQNKAKDQQSASQEQITVHCQYIQLSRKYEKSMIYIKLLEKQLLDLTSSDQFNSQGNKKCCFDKNELIAQLKNLLSSQIC